MDIYVRQGDSLWYFSRLYGINLQLIVDSNHDIQPNQLKAGQRIRIPGFVAQNYQIRHGDSFWEIAQRRNLSLDALLLANPNVNPNRLTVGQTIRVPLRITWRLVQGKQHYDFSRMMNDIARLQNVYPFLRVTNAGNSVLGNRIPEVLIGNGGKRVHYNASFHANEWITTPILMTFLNEYCLSLTNGSSIRGLSTSPLYLQTLLSLVPMVNPDGVSLVMNGPPENETWRNKVIELNRGSTDFSGWKANIR
ncbi:LysM peptidoglycan-binding domain-containing protein, partial [Neobacillus drentensis]|uniref:LysM peptidoglycan-binding domain-containing protein n=1 Tax=Neobacillus drentensis TaxID=220684 RepID=UPI002FFE48A2